MARLILSRAKQGGTEGGREMDFWVVGDALGIVLMVKSRI
jgi:hypothetical protein